MWRCAATSSEVLIDKGAQGAYSGDMPTTTKTERCRNCGEEIEKLYEVGCAGAIYCHLNTAPRLGFTCQADGDDCATPANSREMFFFEHAGWSYQPATETPNQGRMRCARDLALAERTAKSRGWQVRWTDDWSLDHQREFDCYEDGDPETCEMAALYDEEGTVLASLGCIDGATDEYRRVIEAELADEAMYEVVTREQALAKSIVAGIWGR